MTLEAKLRWTAKRLKHLASLQAGDSITSDAIKDAGDYGVFGGNGLRGYSDRFTHDGHFILIGRQGALCGNVQYANGKFWASEHAIVVSPNSEIDIRWLGESLRALQLNRYSQSAAQPGIAAEVISNIELAVPPFSRQREIADYLDRETATIDALIDAKQRLLALLDEKRRAVITHAVMRGVNPTVPMRDSGVPWLGFVPAHWRTERAHWLFRERDDRSVSGEEELLTVSHLTGVTRRSAKTVTMFEAETNEGYKICKAGDLAINTLWAWMGAMGVSAEDGIVSPAYNVYTPGSELAPEFVDSIVRIPAFAQEVTRYSTGVWSSRLRLYPEGFFEVILPLPPLDEQRAIVEHIQRETAKLDALREATERSIALLKERRAALIAAAVTGEIDCAA